MDEAGEIMLGISTNVESWVERCNRSRRRAEQTAGRYRRTWRRDRRATPEFTTENVTGKTWELPHGLPTAAGGDPHRSRLPAEAALENEQIDKATEAMETMSTAQGFEKEKDIVAARGEGSKSVQLGLAQAARQWIFCRNLEDESALLGEPPDLDHGLRRRERKNNQCSLECVAHDGAVLEKQM